MKICIVGLGLIGGSLAKAIKKNTHESRDPLANGGVHHSNRPQTGVIVSLDLCIVFTHHRSPHSAQHRSA